MTQPRSLLFIPVLVLGILLFSLMLVPVCEAKTVTDQLGRSVTLPDRPLRIVSLAPSVTEILYTLKLDKRLIGATLYSDYPAAAQALPKVGSYIRLDLEKIVSLKPDLCIAIKDGNPLTVVQKLTSFNIPVYTVDPRDLDSVMATITELGQLLGAEATARQAITGMKDRIDTVRSHLQKKKNPAPRVFLQIGISPIVSVGTKTFLNNLITMAGGINLAAGESAYPRFSQEEVIAMRPDIMIITTMARHAVFTQVKEKWQQWQDIPAVRNNRIFLVDSNIFDRPSPRLVDALEILAHLIHPECFQDSPQKITQ